MPDLLRDEVAELFFIPGTPPTKNRGDRTDKSAVWPLKSRETGRRLHGFLLGKVTASDLHRRLWHSTKRK